MAKCEACGDSGVIQSAEWRQWWDLAVDLLEGQVRFSSADLAMVRQVWPEPTGPEDVPCPWCSDR